MEVLETITIILVKPKYPENIGSAARVAFNMGIQHLCVVGAGEIDLGAARKTATHNAVHLLDTLRRADSLSEVLTEYSFLVGTTARVGRGRRPTALPGQVAAAVSPYLQSGKVGIMFGPENSGLTNDALQHCGLLVEIPTAGFSSLNLAQAVGIICYELRNGLSAGLACSRRPVMTKSAAPIELGAMFAAFSEVLAELDRQSGREMAETRLQHLHQLFGRSVVSAKEAKMIKDACVQLKKSFKKNVKS